MLTLWNFHWPTNQRAPSFSNCSNFQLDKLSSEPSLFNESRWCVTLFSTTRDGILQKNYHLKDGDATFKATFKLSVTATQDMHRNAKVFLIPSPELRVQFENASWDSSLWKTTLTNQSISNRKENPGLNVPRDRIKSFRANNLIFWRCR